MMDYGLEHVHADLYEVLADALHVLEANALPYSVICGSLLGAVRHQAIIPWDDDVDLVMPRESYDRFMVLYPAQCGAGYTLDLTDTWVPRVRKVNAQAFVDLFILDPLPMGKVARAWKLLRLRALQGMLKEHTDYTRFSFQQKLLLWGTHCLGRLFSRASILRTYQRVSRAGGDSPQVHMSDGAFNLLNMAFDKTTFDHPVPAPFGALSVRIPRDAHAVLIKLYGPEYQTPPPESERKPLHLDR